MNRERIFKSFDKLETERLKLRYLNPKTDAQALYKELYSDPEVTKYDRNKVYGVGDGWYSVVPTMSSKMHVWEEGLRVGKTIVWGLELKSNKELIGTCFCEFYSHGTANIEFKLSKRYWHQGFMGEALGTIIQYLEFHDAKQIICIVPQQSIAAINLCEKLGFVFCNSDEVYLSHNMSMSIGEAVSSLSLSSTMKIPNELVYVRPKISPIAYSNFEQANQARQNGDLRSCAALNSKALQIQPDFIHAQNGLAWAKLDSGDPQGAIVEFNNIIKKRPNKYSAYIGRAYALSDLNKFNEAADDLNRYLYLVPDDSESFVMLGNYLFQAKRYREAYNAYSTALKINPNEPNAYEYQQRALHFL